MNQKNEHMDMKGFGWRVSLSILVSIGWLAFLVIWLFFYAGDFSPYQNIAVFIVSILVAAAIMGASWAPWGMRQKHGWECFEEAERRKEDKGDKEEKAEKEKPKSRKRKR